MTGKTSVILDRICWFEEQPADIFICMYISRKSFHSVIAFPTGHSPYKFHENLGLRGKQNDAE